MAVHFIDCFAPGVGTEAASDRIAAALSRVQRKVLSRQGLTPGGQAPVASPGTLRWRIQKLRDDGGSFLVVEETGPARWDLSFFRALSATVGGIVVAREHHSREERRGLATFLSGRTVEVAARDMQLGATSLGGVTLEQLTGSRSVDAVYEARFAELCSTLALRLREGTVLAAEDWQVSAPVEKFAPEKPSPQSWAFLPNLEAAAWKQALAAGVAKGWEWRTATVRGASFVELRRDGAFNEADVAGFSAKVPTGVTALEVRGAGEPFRWSEAEKGKVSERGTGSGAEELFKVLYRAAVLVGEGPGMVLGRGAEGWTLAR
ncbi:hypothetical protein JY651_51095 [Pyxidicoccus parkwayensis]|uniref:Uncharacterized protein n=1 Tax=Pyxidicoccus parkwayensis TaxID=2813578 RepID=A0ABX7NY66_9BACT|nr:hypothetical protein [Pyxidicoccus parkwaysis]QSQ23334.1 hypothetical protein JY651_51095 [Pyxidicoccus parkwaysis]